MALYAILRSLDFSLYIIKETLEGISMIGLDTSLRLQF